MRPYTLVVGTAFLPDEYISFVINHILAPAGLSGLPCSLQRGNLPKMHIKDRDSKERRVRLFIHSNRYSADNRIGVHLYSISPLSK